ncbi:MAG: O-acetyl-ADP-ribose deacetylase [Bacteroidales bacterium]|nr:O-acetyl-ADP-ribose deacetylase [Bacteroidales bacterium]
MSRIEVLKGNITSLEVDAIVNAANKSLMGGGGVDGAIHSEAGPGLTEECRSLNGCGTGEAKITSGYNLPAKFVIHTVGPIWTGGGQNEEEQLAGCYLNSLRIASNIKLKTIAFPNISTGAYGYPKELAATIAISQVKRYLEENEEIEKVYFVIFDDENLEIYNRMLNQ